MSSASKVVQLPQRGAQLELALKLPKYITLEAWVMLTYGNAVSLKTARRWVHDGYIVPMPEKHGRAYYLRPDARYVDPANPPADLQPSGRSSPFRAKA